MILSIVIILLNAMLCFLVHLKLKNKNLKVFGQINNTNSFFDVKKESNISIKT